MTETAPSHTVAPAEASTAPITFAEAAEQVAASHVGQIPTLEGLREVQGFASQLTERAKHTFTGPDGKPVDRHVARSLQGVAHEEHWLLTPERKTEFESVLKAQNLSDLPAHDFRNALRHMPSDKTSGDMLEGLQSNAEKRLRLDSDLRQSRRETAAELAGPGKRINEKDVAKLMVRKVFELGGQRMLERDPDMKGFVRKLVIDEAERHGYDVSRLRAKEAKPEPKQPTPPKPRAVKSSQALKDIGITIDSIGRGRRANGAKVISTEQLRIINAQKKFIYDSARDRIKDLAQADAMGRLMAPDGKTVIKKEQMALIQQHEQQIRESLPELDELKAKVALVASRGRLQKLMSHGARIAAKRPHKVS